MTAKVCSHRGYPLDENGRCFYHGLCNPPKTFIATDDEIVPFDPEEQPRHFPYADCDNYFTYKQRVACRPEIWAQNTMDFNHLSTVHGDGFGKLFLGKPYDVSISEDKSASSHKIKIKQETVYRYEGLVQRKLSDYFYHFHKFPNFSFTSFLDVFFSTEYVIPLPDGVGVTTKFFVRKSDGVPRMLLSSAKESNTKILQEDKELCERWDKSYCVTGNWLPYESRIRAYCERLRKKK